MLKKERILENRRFSAKEPPYNIFEKKVVGACYLERKIFMEKFGKEEMYLSRSQYIVFLVSCLEYFFQELFKKAMNEKIVDLNKLKKLKEIKLPSLDLEDLEWINENKVKLSEIVSLEMNFQNIKHITFFCDALKIVKNFKIITSRKKDMSNFKELIKNISPNQKKLPEKKITKFILKEFGTIHLPKNSNDLIKIVSTVNKMISLRHGIVHKAQLIKIENWESLAYTMATVQLAFFAHHSYLLEKENLKIA